MTKLVFLREAKNWAFLLPAGYLLYLISGSFGTVGKIIGWVGIAMFSAFAMWALFTAGLRSVSLLGTPFTDKIAPLKNGFWKSVQVIIMLVSVAVDTAMALLTYAGTYGVNVKEYVFW